MPYWLPAVAVCYALQGYLSHHAGSPRYAVALWLVGCLPLWPVIASYSKQIAFDAIMFDSTLVVAFYFGMWYAGAAVRFGGWQWCGFTMAVVGLALMKAGA